MKSYKCLLLLATLFMPAAAHAGEFVHVTLAADDVKLNQSPAGNEQVTFLIEGRYKLGATDIAAGSVPIMSSLWEKSIVGSDTLVQPPVLTPITLGPGDAVGDIKIFRVNFAPFDPSVYGPGDPDFFAKVRGPFGTKRVIVGTIETETRTSYPVGVANPTHVWTGPGGQTGPVPGVLAQGLAFSASEQEFDLRLGESRTISTTVQNLTNQPQVVLVTARQWSIDDGAPQGFDISPLATSVGPLLPGEAQQVDFVVSRIGPNAGMMFLEASFYFDASQQQYLVLNLGESTPVRGQPGWTSCPWGGG